LRAEFASGNAAAVAALRAYLAALEAGRSRIRAARLRSAASASPKCCALQELVPIPLATYERVGEDALEKTKAEFVATAKAIDPAKSPGAVAASCVRSTRPPMRC
jgi:hypothetical protein